MSSGFSQQRCGAAPSVRGRGPKIEQTQLSKWIPIYFFRKSGLITTSLNKQNWRGQIFYAKKNNKHDNFVTIGQHSKKIGFVIKGLFSQIRTTVFAIVRL